MGYDWKIGATKTLRDFVITCIAVLTAYFAVPENLTVFLGAFPVSVKTAVVPLLSSLFVFLHNWATHREGN